jgi:hypothetical protein
MREARVITPVESINRALQDADDALEDVKHDLNELLKDLEVLRLKVASIALGQQIDETNGHTPR